MKAIATIMATLLLAFSFSLNQAEAGAHHGDHCDEVHQYAEQPATYTGDIPGLMKYYKKHLSPILLTCKREQGSKVTSMQLELVIGKSGKVQSVKFPDLKAAEACKNKIRENIMQMEGWQPAKIKGKPVCAKFYWPIAGIKWKQ